MFMLGNSGFRKNCIGFFLCGLLATAFLVALGSTISFGQLLGQLHYVDPDAVPTLNQEQVDAYYGGNTEISDSLPQLPEPAAPIPSSKTVHILLIGQDRMEGEPRARSDSLILCTVNFQDQTLTMTSFLRDLYVEIPGYRNNRINAAYTAGGMKLLNQTLETNFGIRVDGNIEVDFSQFPKIIDLLGGVTLELRQDEADAINKSTAGSLSAGTHLLNGKQALAYARIRKLDADGDFSRTARQRKLLEVLLQSCRNASLPTLLSLLKEILPMVTTDMSKDTLKDLALELLPILSRLEVKSQHIPAEGTYNYRTIRGMSVLVADMEAARKLLRETLASEAE